ncbi:DUF2726 domain-containing protein [[Haemophilus] ducreyi]|uniref:DUF2726 domain-containing protein n=1 Tax=Haemophilus ducreyi TaxID=730 RepID=UPI00065574C1|nr:DUF2726 domain-containing protein [[Haemophilus] ducreyi]AKO45637.1 hypothetical protein RZ66_05250 [[Haemophilus] ducreyi]AKO48368.1 hypothetical protein RZ68_05150 [[Haemophilus] ducreyi]ANF61363.1 hypothetical protein A6037_00530 [[Haemophilus] ducreyi]ANF67446.1 hypothetical protein A6041_02130 [[Haemophilus] ducreyi]ANF68677.1 hypothetical protein A6042_01205 [[Haemophilus] ducreyi]
MDPKNMVILLIVFLIFGVVIKISLKRKSRNTLPNGKLFRKCQIVNRTEKELFFKIKGAVPEYITLVQVPFSCIVKPKHFKYDQNKKLFWKVNQKRVDFVICNQNFETLCIVELDGSSHKNKHHLDEERDTFFEKCGIETVRFSVKELYKITEVEIRKRIIQRLKNRI